MLQVSSMNRLYRSDWHSIQNDMRMRQIMGVRGQKVSQIPALSPIRREFTSANAKFLRDYQAKLTGLMAKSNQFRSNSVQWGYHKASDNPGVLSVSSSQRHGTPAETVSVQVHQLAKAQENQTAFYETEGRSFDLSGTITIQSKNKTMQLDLSAYRGKTNSEKLNALADAVNQNKHLGLQAEVLEKDSKSSLVLHAAESGKENAFTVSGSLADQSGLSFVSQAAQNARYTVQKGSTSEELESAFNTISLKDGSTTIHLKEVGRAQIHSAKGGKVNTASVRDLVNSYNDTLKFMNDHASMGSGVMRTMEKLLRAPLSDASMDSVGIHVKKDGTLEFDEAAFEASTETNSALFSGHSGIADRFYDAARSGMNVASARLLDTSGLQPLRQSAEPAYAPFASENPFTLLNQYARRNPYQFSGSDLVGLLINLNA